MFVYLVFHYIAYEGAEVLGAFSSYDKARAFELDHIAKEHIVEGRSEWTEIRKIELDKVDYELFSVGEKV